MRRILSLPVAIAILALPCAAAWGQQPAKRVEVGVLRCDVAPSFGLIIGSQQRIDCVFTPRGKTVGESYQGAITRLGLDIGFSGGGRLMWGVRAPTTEFGSRALAGSYVGASGDIALVGGVGVNALVGGSNRTISLQPLSMKGQVGANLALGVAKLTLQ